jgi:predicted nucleic acid-binding protein
MSPGRSSSSWRSEFLSDDHLSTRLTDLRDDFRSFYAPTPQERREAIMSGLVVIDTNVLLDLYRFTPTARQELVEILRMIGDRLFVPHQVAMEYHLGRVGAVVDHKKEHADVDKRLADAWASAQNALSFLSKRRALGDHELADVGVTLEEAFDSVRARVKSLSQSYDLDPGSIQYIDPIRDVLEGIARGKVGRPLEEAQEARLVQEFVRKDREETLPGDEDRGRKPARRAAGDFLIWCQMKLEASIRGLPVLFVSGDDKKDWVHRDGGKTERPRRELVEEMWKESNVRFIMVLTRDFLALAHEHLHAEVSATTLAETSRPRRPSSRSSEAVFALEKLPHGRPGAGYLERVLAMVEIADGNTTLKQFISEFQQRFPSITRPDVARRRALGILESLGLADFDSDQISLTPEGEQFLRSPVVELLQDALLSRIKGAAEVLELMQELDDDELRQLLTVDPPGGISSTQALRILQWLRHLGLSD